MIIHETKDAAAPESRVIKDRSLIVRPPKTYSQNRTAMGCPVFPRTRGQDNKREVRGRRAKNYASGERDGEIPLPLSPKYNPKDYDYENTFPSHKINLCGLNGSTVRTSDRERRYFGDDILAALEYCREYRRRHPYEEAHAYDETDVREGGRRY